MPNYFFYNRFENKYFGNNIPAANHKSKKLRKKCE